MVNLAKKPRKLSRLEQLSVNALKRMGLDAGANDSQSLLASELLKSLNKVIQNAERRILKKMDGKIAELQLDREQKGVPSFISVSSGDLSSTPSPGSKKIKNMFVTPDGKFFVEYEDNPV